MVQEPVSDVPSQCVLRQAAGRRKPSSPLRQPATAENRLPVFPDP
jgi:hypothetical protein